MASKNIHDGVYPSQALVNLGFEDAGTYYFYIIHLELVKQDL